MSDLDVSPEDGATASADQDEPVMVVVSRLVKRGKVDVFERWIRGIGNEALRFPGHQGINVIRPTDPARPEYVVIFRFDRYSNLRCWVDSDERQMWLEKVEPLVVGPMKVKELSGMEGWVSLPGAALVAPPRYKTAIATWFAIFPISLALSAWVVPRMLSVPLFPRTRAISACLVLLMTYAVMPAVTRLLRSWLFAQRDRK